MTRNKRRVRAVLGALALAAVVYAAIVLAADWRSIEAAIRGLPLLLMPVLLLFVLVGYGWRALRWHLYVNRLGPAVPWSTSVRTYLGGFSLGMTPARVGELVKTVDLAERAGTPYRASLASVIAERATDLVSVLALLTIGLTNWGRVGLAVGLSLLALATALVLAVRSRRGAGLLVRAMGRLPPTRRLAGEVDALHLESIQLLAPRWLAIGASLSLVTWAMETTVLWSFCRALGVDVGWTVCAFAFASASLAGILSLLPGGLGAKEGGMIAVLTYFGAALPQAASVTILTRAATFWFGILVGSVAVLSARPRSKPSTPLDMSQPVPGFPVLGTRVSAVRLDESVAWVLAQVRAGRRTHVCVCSVNMVMLARRLPTLRTALANAGLVVPDGYPLTRLGQSRAPRPVGRVRGTDLVQALCAPGAGDELRVYLYGGAPDVDRRMARRLIEANPRLQVVGHESPPFRPLTDKEDAELVARLNGLRPDVVLVGLGCPKQEAWIMDHRDRLAAPVLIGVGAAFDFIAGTKRAAPRWIQRLGLEWLWRFLHEPGRLWRRVLVEGPAFVVLTVWETLRGKGSPASPPKQHV